MTHFTKKKDYSNSYPLERAIISPNAPLTILNNISISPFNTNSQLSQYYSLRQFVTPFQNLQNLINIQNNP